MGRDLDLDDVAADHPVAAAELAELRAAKDTPSSAAAPWGRSERLREIRDRQATPPELVRAAGRALTLSFAFDLCAEPATAKGSRFWTREDDALAGPWARRLVRQDVLPGAALWLNPPYSEISLWTARAVDAAQHGYIVVGLLPDDRSTGWYQKDVDGIAHTVLCPRARINFLDPDSGETIRGNPRPSILPVWGPWGPWSWGRTDTRHLRLDWPPPRARGSKGTSQ